MKPETKQALTEYLEGLLRLLGEPATQIQFTTESDKEVMVNLVGLQSIDGTDPKPLRSLSYLTEISMRRKTGKGIKVHLDANGRQAQRLLDLKALAQSSAQSVLNTLQRVELAPMETQDRKLIHEFLSEVEGVKTHSEGHGDERRIIIEPMSHLLKQSKEADAADKAPSPHMPQPESAESQPQQAPSTAAPSESTNEEVTEKSQSDEPQDSATQNNSEGS